MSRMKNPPHHCKTTVLTRKSSGGWECKQTRIYLFPISTHMVSSVTSPLEGFRFLRRNLHIHSAWNKRSRWRRSGQHTGGSKVKAGSPKDEMLGPPLADLHSRGTNGFLRDSPNISQDPPPALYNKVLWSKRIA